MFDAIILAGGTNSRKLSEVSAQSYEALIEIAGKPMVTFVAEALAQSPQVERIIVVGPAKQLANCEFPARTVIVEGGASIMETIKLGVAALGHERKVLIATADIPLLTADAVADFLQQCQDIEADLYYPIVKKEVNERRYPGNKRTYVRLKEGTFTGGNIFFVNPRIIPQCMNVAERIFANRKNPFKLCCMLGWKFVLKFICGMLTLPEVVARVSEILGIRGAVIQSLYPELGIDVDKPSDLELVRSTFSLRL